MVVVIDYFGFPFEMGWEEEARGRGAVVVRDACQALLSTAESVRSDYHVYSPRKFLGIPDGGILTGTTVVPEERRQLEEAPAEWWLGGLVATVLRRSFDRHGGVRDWFELFQRYEATAPVGTYRMSEVSRRIIEATDHAALAERRVRNYRVLADLLGDIALFPNLPAGVVPLGFPVRVPSRDKLRKALFDREIYPAVHWPVPSAVPGRFAEPRRLAAEVMTLPCDQRYSPGTMERVARLVSTALER
jgi:dTDP-4-amino-4,6-dideoxygalactose transaminase